MGLAREMFRFDQFIQREEIDVNIPKSSAVRDMAFFEKEEKVVLQGYESIKRHYKEHLESEMQFVIDDVVDQLKTNDIALVDWKYLEYYLCPSSKRLSFHDREKIFNGFISELVRKSDFREIELSSEKVKNKYLSEKQLEYQENSYMLYLAPKGSARKINFTVSVSSPYTWALAILFVLLVVSVLLTVIITVTSIN